MRPTIKTVRRDEYRRKYGLHQELLVTWDGIEHLYCGYTWCKGECGLPAIVIGDRKGSGEMVATGNVMQPWRVVWTGTTVEVPEKYREWFLRRFWM